MEQLKPKFSIYQDQKKGGKSMEYVKPKTEEVKLDVKGIERENNPDGPSRCSNSCCFYRDGATW